MAFGESEKTETVTWQEHQAAAERLMSQLGRHVEGGEYAARIATVANAHASLALIGYLQESSQQLP